MRFRDRRDAGRQLAARLQRERLEQLLVLALPRGSVPVAAEIASSSGAPLDVLVVRKVGAPFHREYGIGAVAEPDVTIRDARIRRFVTLHAFAAFVFNIGVLAFTINVLGSN